MNASDTHDVVRALREAVSGAWRGREQTVDWLLTAVFAGGHVLLEDVPGVGKTTMAQALALGMGGRLSRVQFTSDLLPGDVTGVLVLGPGTSEPVFRPGPVFAHVVLADEINRGTPRTQSALLEAMAEGAVSVDGTTRPLPAPFLVVATQNPHDAHGTWPLPDSQLDRFLLRMSLGYPGRAEERAILRQEVSPAPVGAACTTPEAVQAGVRAAQAVHVAEAVEDHLLDLATATRGDARLLRGVSPRGAQALYRASKALAWVRGRAFVLPEDVRELAVPVWAHRVVTRGHPDDAGAVVAAIVAEHAPPG